MGIRGSIRRRFVLLLVGVGMLLARKPAGADGSASLLVTRLGMTMSQAAARHGIAFRPFAPARTIIDVALLPPFHGADDRAGRGIAFEYVDAHDRRYVLAQWPMRGGTIERFAPYFGNRRDCANVRSFARGTKPNGIVWTTPHGLVLTLQPDGVNDARTLEIEWVKLIRRGACQ